MSNEEIRFNRGEASAYLKKNGKIRYEKDKDRTLKNNLQSIFDSIAGIEGNKNKIDTDYEKSLLSLLQLVFNADGDSSLSEEELEWAKSFDGENVAEFIGNKNNEIQQAKADAEAARVKAEQEAKEAKERAEQEAAEKERQAAEEQAQREAEEQAKLAEEARQAAIAEKQAARAAFDNSINKIKNNTNLSGVTTNSYTIKKGDSFWKIATEQLKAEGTSKPKNKDIMDRIALIAKINGIDSVTGYKLRAVQTLEVPTSVGNSNTPTPVEVTEVTQEFLDEHDELQSVNATLWQDDDEKFYVVAPNENADDEWDSIDATIWKDESSGNLYYVRN